jgi:type IV pilus assembly protein PilB
MTAEQPRATGEHWCARLARRAGWPGAEQLDIAPGLGSIEAWASVVSGCQIPEADLAHEVARAFRLDPVRWETVEPQATKLLPERVARKHLIYPVREDYKSIYIATADPNDITAEQAVGFASGRHPIMQVASPQAIAAAIEAGYAPQDAAATLLKAAGSDLQNAVRVAERQAPEAVRAEEAAAAPVISLANLILRDGVNGRASDIHIEPGRVNGIVRFRVDGVMREYLQLPMPVFNRVVSRIKVMGGLDIADRMRPQDGRSRIQLPDGKTVDLRLSTVPTRDSEKAVIRILDAASTRKLGEVGLPAQELQRIMGLIQHRDGVILLTGPTGSGKTTTLYGAIQDLSDGQVNIVTIEDPVEYEVPGITQIQVETKRGVTFASTLRAVLRQDPDIVFVGEIRDAETAQTAAHAALTGHLVLSTLHTNDAIGVIARLADLGLDRATIATSLRGAVAQRLVRRLCDACAIPVTDPLTPEEARLAALTGVRPARRAVGCDRCSGSGYFGRLAVAEVFVVSPAIEAMIAKDEPIPAILDLAKREGMRQLSTVVLDAVANGSTTLEEAERVTGFTDMTPPSAQPARRRVLLVDDDPVVGTMAATLLAREGFDCEQVANGAVALERIVAGDHGDIVILDLGLPGLGGREVLRRVRAHPATQRLPIVIFTGSEDESLEAELMDEGADDYLRKPVDPARFVARIRAVLRRAGQR